MVLYKRFVSGLGLVACGALLLAGCAQPTEEKKDTSTPDPFASATGTLDGWTASAGDGNGFDSTKFKLIYVTNGTGRALALQYGASAAYGLANLYFDPMDAGDVSGYDQLLFDVKSSVPVNFGTVLRGSDAENGTTQVWQAASADQYHAATAGAYETHTLNLSTFQNMTGWGSNSTFASAAAFLDGTADNTNWSQLNFLVTQNPGESGSDNVGATLVLYIDNVRLHDTATSSPKADKVLFDFEP